MHNNLASSSSQHLIKSYILYTIQIGVHNISPGKFSGSPSDFHFHFHLQDADWSSQHFPWKVFWLVLGLLLSLSISGCRSEFATFPLESSLAHPRTFIFTFTFTFTFRRQIGVHNISPGKFSGSSLDFHFHFYFHFQ